MLTPCPDLRITSPFHTLSDFPGSLVFNTRLVQRLGSLSLAHDLFVCTVHFRPTLFVYVLGSFGPVEDVSPTTIHSSNTLSVLLSRIVPVIQGLSHI